MLSEDELVLSLIATGLILLAEQVNRGEPFGYPYPKPLQRGMDKLAVLRLRRGQAPPLSITELIEWCQSPLQQWELELPDGVIGSHDCLLDGSRPTNVCESWACASADVEAELSESQYMKSLLEICQASRDPAMYTAFRRLLVERPVLGAMEFQVELANPAFHRLAEHLRAGYQEAPTTCLFEGYYLKCGTCGNLLVRTRKGTPTCENERCNIRAGGGPERIAGREQLVWLKRSLRRFIAAPGQAELRLFNALEARRLRVELWPQYDAYDLRIVFADGSAWAVDVKDWANPVLLARSVGHFPTEPVWSRAFYVFPDERRRERGDYARAFRNYCRFGDKQVKAVFESQLLQTVDRIVGELHDA